MRISSNQFQQSSVQAILGQQSRLSHIQQQVATDRRILSPSDDPTGSARILELAKSIETIERYSRNADHADSRMRIEEGVLKEVGNVIIGLRELAVQANNASVTPIDRKSIAAEVRQRQEQLIQLANSTDGNGEYLFAGGQSKTRPFQREDGELAYRGDQSTRYAQVGPGRQIATTHSGFETFMKIPNGANGYAVSAGEDNTGSGVISTVDVSNAGNPDPPYDIDIVDDGSGGLEYQVGGTTGPFEAGESIEIDGLSVTIDGTPEAGDSFTIERSSPQSLFETVDRFADALEAGGSGASANADFLNIGNRTLTDLDSAHDRVPEVRAELGGRMNRLDAEKNANEVAVLELTTTKSEIEDLDYASALTELNRRLVGLQAAQQSYSKIQGLTLFNYL